MAYNAGLSRVRGWERRFADFPDHLLAEALPYRETRNYLHKILVSAIYYGYLYQRQDPWETVLSFFPELRLSRNLSQGL
jgi:soluble lytic murein transglycosylase